MNHSTSSCALHSDDWTEELFGKYNHSAPTEEDAGATIQQSPLALPTFHQFIGTLHPPNGFATGSTSNPDLITEEFYDGSYPNSTTVSSFPIATLPNISATEPISMAPIALIPAAATPIPLAPSAMRVGRMIIPPSPPTSKNKIGYEIIHEHDFETRFPTYIVAKLNKSGAAGTLLYVVPTAGINTCTLHEPFIFLSERSTVNNSRGSRMAEDQCELCFRWFSLGHLDPHRRRHCPPVWKCEDCAYHLIQNTTFAAARVAFVKHYARCRGGGELERKEVVAPASLTGQRRFWLMASTGGGSPSPKPAEVEEMTPPPALPRQNKRRRVMSPTSNSSPPHKSVSATHVKRAATHPTCSAASAPVRPYPYIPECASSSGITSGNNNGAFFMAPASLIGQRRFWLMASTGGDRPSPKPAEVEEMTPPPAFPRQDKRRRLMSPKSNGRPSHKPVPATHVRRTATHPTCSAGSASVRPSPYIPEGASTSPWASGMTSGNNSGTFLSAASGSSLNSLYNTQITEAEHPEGLAGTDFGWPAITGIHIPDSLTPQPLATWESPILPASTNAGIGDFNMNPDFDFLSANIAPAPSLSMYTFPPMTPDPLFAPYAPSEVMQMMWAPNPEEDSNDLGQDKGKEKAQDGGDDDWLSSTAWLNTQMMSAVDFSSAQDICIHEDASLAQWPTNGMYSPSNWGFATDSLQLHLDFGGYDLPIDDNCTQIGKRKRTEDEEEYGGDTWAIEPSPIAEDEIAAELMNATREELSGALQALIQNIQSGAGGEM